MFYEFGQNARHFMLFSMCSTCEISIEDEQFGLQGWFCSSLNYREIGNFSCTLKCELKFKTWKLSIDKDIFDSLCSIKTLEGFLAVLPTDTFFDHNSDYNEVKLDNPKCADLLPAVVGT